MNTVVALIIYGTIIGLLVYFKRQQQLLFSITFIFNYFVMGLTRYINIPMPTSVLMDIIWISLFIYLLCNKKERSGEKPIILYCFYGIWTLYTVLEILNDACGLGLDVVAWFKDVRVYGFDPLIIMLIYTYAFTKKKDIENFLILWGVLLLLLALRCFAQVKIGFDHTEYQWLQTAGFHTHVLHAGTLIRYFSFFSDAANLGSHTAVGGVIFAVLFMSVPKKQIKKKLFYLFVSIGSFYCMFMSGARAAMFVAIACATAFVFLSKNRKIFIYTFIVLIVGLYILVFTPYGNGIQAVRRMRTAFQTTEDASMNLRELNKKAIASYLVDAPFGIGLGKDGSNIPPSNRYHIVAVTAPDSSLVYFWMRTGIVGLYLFMAVSILIIIGGAYIVWFKIQDKELRTFAGLFTAGCASWLVAGYANQVYFQYPNSMIFFGMQTLVYMMPFFDKKLQQEQLLNNKNKNENEKEVEEIEELQERLETT